MSPRSLTAGEWAELSQGLSAALASAGAVPAIEARAHPAAFLGRLRFGATPIMALGRTIWWPGARPDFSGAGRDMAVLQHELQHVLDFAEGKLSVLRYLASPRHWTYRWRLAPGLDWERLGAEQRAAMAEALWLAERGGPDQATLTARLREIIPWARPSGGLAEAAGPAAPPAI